MANIRSVTGRHVWAETILKHGNERVPGIICKNCRAYRYGRDGDRPVTGCLSDVDVSRLGDSRLGDYREQEMRRRKEQNDAEYAQDLADIAMVRRASDDSDFQKHLDKMLEREIG